MRRQTHKQTTLPGDGLSHAWAWSAHELLQGQEMRTEEAEEPPVGMISDHSPHDMVAAFLSWHRQLQILPL